MVGFKYPMSLKEGDLVTIDDPETGRRWSEPLILEPKRVGDRVELWTRTPQDISRHLFVDPGLKVQVSE